MWGTVISAATSLGSKALGMWSKEEAKDLDAQVARLENRDQWVMRLCTVVIFGPWVWAWFDPEGGMQAVRVMQEFPGWYTALVQAAAAAGLGLSAHKQNRRAKQTEKAKERRDGGGN